MLGKLRDYLTTRLIMFSGAPTLTREGQFTVKSDGNAYVFTGGAEVALSTGGGGGGGAPTGAEYLTLATNGSLTHERVLTPSAPLAGTDGGAGSTYTLSLSGWPGTNTGDLLFRDGTAVGTKTASQARSFLSLVVGTNVQAWDADLDGLAALGDGIPVRTSGTWAASTADTVVSDAAGANGIVVRTSAGVVGVATITAPLTLTGSTLDIDDATTSAAGIVELATDGEATAAKVVQGNDSRLASAGAAALALCILAGFGAGGDLTLDGSTAIAWGSWSTISGVRTLTVTAATTLEYDTVTFDFTTYISIAIVTKGARFIVRSIVSTGTGTGYIDWNGGAASGSTGGAGAAAVAASAPYAGGQTGVNGRNTSGSGNAAGTYNSGVSLGGIGGGGGAGGANPGGATGAFTRDYTPGNSNYGSLVDFMLLAMGKNWVSAGSQNQFQLSGGGCGSAGGNQVTGVSGGGGGGAGVVGLMAGKIDMGANTLYVRVIGGNGGNAAGTSGAGTSGGGGGGGGGAILMAVANAVSPIVLSANGGVGGDGATADADIGVGGTGGRGGLVACIYGSGTAPTGTADGGTGGTGSDAVVAATGAAGTVFIVSAAI